MDFNKLVSYVLHAVAGGVIVAGPLALAGIPESITSLTVGGILAIVFKWAHDYAGY